MMDRLTQYGNNGADVNGWLDKIFAKINRQAYLDLKKAIEKLATWESLAQEGRLVVMPCKPGDDLYWVDDEDGEWHVKRTEKGIRGVIVYRDGIFQLMTSDGEIEDIGTRWTYLKREDAVDSLKKALERMGDG